MPERKHFFFQWISSLIVNITIIIVGAVWMDAKIQIAHLNQQLNWSLSFLWRTSYLFGCIIWTKYFYIVLNCLIWVKAIMRILHDVVLQIITNRFNYSKFLYFSNGLKWYYKAFVQQCSKSIKKWMAARKQGSSLSRRWDIAGSREREYGQVEDSLNVNFSEKFSWISCLQKMLQPFRRQERQIAVKLDFSPFSPWFDF